MAKRWKKRSFFRVLKAILGLPSLFSDENLRELTQPDLSNRPSVGDSPADLQTLANDVILSDFGQVWQRATRQLVTSADADRRTVLMLVADAPETPVHTEKCILYLFELGANPTAADANGDTAAHLAARRDHLRLLTLLSFDEKWLQNDNGATPLMEAARTGSWKCAKHLLHLLRQWRFNDCIEYGNSKRSRLLGLKDREGQTASDLARLSGHSELASYIEREMRLVVDAFGRISGLTAQEEADRQELQRLAKAGDSAGLRRAVTRGSCDLPDNEGCAALMWAAQNSSCGDEALWEQLVQLGDPTCANIWAESCLHHAARAGNFAATSALLAAGASANARDWWESTPLMRAANGAPPTTAAAVGRALLYSGADWSLKIGDGRTALELSIQKGNIELADLLGGYHDQIYFDEPLALPPVGPLFLKRWDAVRLIGRGGFGEVHKVRTDTGVTCAAKTLRLPVQLGDELLSVSTQIHRAVESERNLCRLRHPNIVRFLHIAQPEPATVIVFMELLDGRSLERFIDNKPLEEPKIRDFSEQICRALLYLHSRQPPVIHRDINCSNIIVCADNTRVKLIDFGLSIKLEQSVSHMSASTQSPKGTLNFMAPELLGAGESDSVQYSRESDIWAFGCSVFQMASGARPFANARSLLEMVQLIDRRGAPALSDGLSAELRDFYSRCTDMDRKSRKSVQELLDHEFFIVSPVFRDSWDFVRFVARGFFGDIQEVVTDRGIRCAAKTLNLPVQLGDQKETKTKKIDKAVKSERNLCRLRHPNIVRFLHIAQPEPATVIVFMELLDGRSLERFIDNKPLEEPKIRDFSEQICRALLYLHSRQPPVIHRDINCSNIIVCADNTRVKLIDFGLSIKLEQSVSHMSASTQSPKGTLNFMAPELLGAGESDSVQYSRESDIWAFGCSVFQMASGARPFRDAQDINQVADRIRNSGAPAMPDGRSAELQDFYSHCTAKDRRERHSAEKLFEHDFLRKNSGSQR
ncbi:hypothetical protein BOX15_Mlig034440g1 [Macrostomum lignano]|uniref:Protein kinase domain-containing protein n=2 Tax=Macrostomum lignano TaxID=282301 RepID=A0A267FP34_9PLAT|nr:hypothetical protein BOX15_Mlig034440g1 [Macrostomum lignano]